MYCKMVSLGGSITTVNVHKEETDEKIVLSLKKEDIAGDCSYVDFCPDFLVSGIDSQGYAVVPQGTNESGVILCRFHERQDCEYMSVSNVMPIMGFKTSEQVWFAVVTGMTFEYKTVVGVHDGQYYMYPRFFVDAKTRYEDIVVEYYRMPEDSDYNDMAALYRQIKKPVLLKDRAKENPCLAYAAESMEIRIRLAWKPVPTPVKCQTEENEPEVIVGCTLERVKDILDGLKARGVDKAEICLVGIETRGHDGRWPQLLPIEEKIGGREQLEEVCAYGQKLGYQMVVHTNSSEMYQISADWDENDLIVTKEGEYSKDEILWGGGQPFHICPIRTIRYTDRNLEAVKEMGFKGVHYIDVLTNFSPRNCYSKAHPVTARESAELICKIGQKTRDLFGGFACEGGFDFAADVLDYVLYTSYNLYGEQHPMCDETLPFWQLVYHGSILYNPSTETVNYGVKEEISRLKFIEYGGRPLGYFNSKYVDEVEGSCGNWMGTEDLLCETDKQLEDSLDIIKAMYDEYCQLRELQYAVMLKHEKLDEGIYRILYSDQTEIIVDYGKKSYRVEKATCKEK